MLENYSLLGWGGFSVYWKCSGFFQNWFFGFTENRKPKEPKKIGKTEERHVLILNLSCIGFRTPKSFYTLPLKCRNQTGRFGSFLSRLVKTAQYAKPACGKWKTRVVILQTWQCICEETTPCSMQQWTRKSVSSAIKIRTERISKLKLSQFSNTFLRLFLENLNSFLLLFSN